MPATWNIATMLKRIVLHAAKSEAATHQTTGLDVSQLEGKGKLSIDTGAITGSAAIVVEMCDAVGGTYVVVPTGAIKDTLTGAAVTSGALAAISATGTVEYEIDLDIVSAFIRLNSTITTGPHVYNGAIIGTPKARG